MQKNKETNYKSVIVFSSALVILIVVSVIAFTSSEAIQSNFLTGLVFGTGTNEAIVGNLSNVFNQDALNYDKEYTKQYLNRQGNFSQLNFKIISADNEIFILSMGNKVDDLRGIKINQSNFAVHLVYCNEFERYCKFRINGIPTTKLYPTEMAGIEKNNSFKFEKDYILKINSIKFNQCDNHRFCNLGFEGYHLVNISVEKKI